MSADDLLGRAQAIADDAEGEIQSLVMQRDELDNQIKRLRRIVQALVDPPQKRDTRKPYPKASKRMLEEATRIIFEWGPEREFIAPELAEAMKRSRATASETVRALRADGFVYLAGKRGMAPTYRMTEGADAPR